MAADERNRFLHKPFTPDELWRPSAARSGAPPARLMSRSSRRPMDKSLPIERYLATKSNSVSSRHIGVPPGASGPWRVGWPATPLDHVPGRTGRTPDARSVPGADRRVIRRLRDGISTSPPPVETCFCATPLSEEAQKSGTMARTAGQAVRAIDSVTASSPGTPASTRLPASIRTQSQHPRR